MPNSSSRLPPIPEPAKWGRRRILLVALVISLLVHLAGGVVFNALRHAFPNKNVTEEALRVQKITISTPPPTPKPTPSPRPTASPTPPPTPKPKIAVNKRPEPPHRVIPPPAPAPARPHELSVQKKGAPYNPPVHKLSGTAELIAQAEAMSVGTIKSAQHDVGQTAAPASGGGGEIYGGGLCEWLDKITIGNFTYGYLTNCHVRYSDGYSEIVSEPWRYKFPKDDFPVPGQEFAWQPPPPDYHPIADFPLTRKMCEYFRTQCLAIMKRDAAAGTPDDPRIIEK